MRNSTKFVLSLAMAFCLVGMAKALTPSSKVYVKDWTAAKAFDWYNTGCNTDFPNLEGAVLNIEKASAAVNSWDTQVQVATGIPTIIGNDYTVRLRMKGSEDGTIACGFGTWGDGKADFKYDINVTTTMQNVDIHYTNAIASDSWVIVWAGSYAGTLSIESVEVYCNSLLFYSYDYTGKDAFPWYHAPEWGDKPTVDDELTATNDTERGDPTNYMFFVADNIYTEASKDYIVRAKIKGDVAGTIRCNFGTWDQNVTENLSFTDEYQDVTVHFTGLPTANNSHVIFHIGKYVGTVSLKKIEVLAYVPENIPVTAAGYATYSSSNALDLAQISGGTAYIVADQSSNGSVPLTEINTAVPANTGLLIKCEGGGTVTIPVADSGVAPTTNYLIASDGTEVGINNYVFAYENGTFANPGFYKLTEETTVPTGKAYLSSGAIPPSAKANFLPFEGTASEVIAPEVEETEEEEVLYNMAGVRVDKNFKGFVINQKGVKRFNR